MSIPISLSPSPPSLRASTSPKSSHSARHSISLSQSTGLKGEIPARCLLVPTDRTVEELEEKWLHRLGRLRIVKEVELYGYALYAIRSWCLSRTHWSQSIVTQTGKPNEHVSFYLLAPEDDDADVTKAAKVILSETHGVLRRTQYGTLVVASPSSFGQDVFPVPRGDLRLAKPYLTMTTDLRRLGCGGRSAMGMEAPIPAVRRKCIDLYRLPAPPTISLAPSPTASPTRADTPDHDITTDPFTHMVLELVRLIQASLVLWGMVSDDLEIDGHFCDETKKGVSAWRKTMGLEHESMRLEKETSGGCIDPKTLATLLSSITSTRFQLESLDVERLPKDPLSSTARFLRVWRQYQSAFDPPAQFLTVPSVRALCARYLDERTRPQDALKHRLFSGVATATSSISANLKGGTQDDVLRRKDAHHMLRARVNGTTGLSLVVPAGEVGPNAPPDVMTSDLEAYTRGILKSREKDWDMMGARRIATLWSGDDVRRKSHFRHGVRRKHDSPDEDDKPRGPLGKVTTLRAIKDSLDAVRRRTTDTSDSETGGLLAKQKVPVVVEPTDSILESTPASPSASVSHLHVDGHATSTSHSPIHGPITSNEFSDNHSAQSHRPSLSVQHDNTLPPRSTALLRTCSDGADVSMDERGMEWKVLEPHGTAQGRLPPPKPLVRRHSLQDRSAYKNMRVLPVANLEIDVGLCRVVLDLRQKEKILRRKAAEAVLFEQSILKAAQVMIDAARSRRLELEDLQAEAKVVQNNLQKVVDEVDEDESILWASKKIEFYLSEETDLGDVVWSLRELERESENVRRMRREQQEDKGWWKW